MVFGGKEDAVGMVSLFVLWWIVPNWVAPVIAVVSIAVGKERALSNSQRLVGTRIKEI